MGTCLTKRGPTWWLNTPDPAQRAAATRLLEMDEEELATEMERQAAELEQRGQADPQRLRRLLRYETRKLTR